MASSAVTPRCRHGRDVQEPRARSTPSPLRHAGTCNLPLATLRHAEARSARTSRVRVRPPLLQFIAPPPALVARRFPAGRRLSTVPSSTPEKHKEATMFTAFDRTLTRLAGFVFAAAITVAILAGLDGLAQHDQGAYLAKATATAARG